MSFEPNNDMQQEEVAVDEHHIDVFAILKFVLAVVVAVSIVVYALIWMKQHTGMTTSLAPSADEAEVVAEEAVPPTLEEREALMRSVEEADHSDEEEQPTMEERSALMQSVESSEDESDSTESPSLEDRQRMMEEAQQ